MKYTDGKNIMVYAQSADGAPVGAALETVSKAAELAKANGEEVIAVVFGKDTDTKTVITAGASKVLVAGEEGLQAEEKAQILAKLAEKYDLVADFFHRHVEVLDLGEGTFHFVQFVIMGGKERFGMIFRMFVQIFDDRPGNRNPVVSRSTSS